MTPEIPICARRRSILPAVLAAAALAALAGIGYLALPSGSMAPVVDVKPGAGTGPAMCPWRDPEGDLRAFFPDSTGSRTDTFALSGIRQRILQRLPKGSKIDSNSLYVYRAMKREAVLGSILVRRASGPHGAIEVVLAVGRDHKVLGVTIQRHREPTEVAKTITSGSFLGAFKAQSSVSASSDSTITGPASAAADVVARSVKEMLIELDEAERYYRSGTDEQHH